MFVKSVIFLKACSDRSIWGRAKSRNRDEEHEMHIYMYAYVCVYRPSISNLDLLTPSPLDYHTFDYSRPDFASRSAPPRAPALPKYLLR